MCHNEVEGLGTYLTAAQITSAFGICQACLFNLMKRGEFPAGVKIGRCRRWALSEVLSWLEGQTQEEGVRLA